MTITPQHPGRYSAPRRCATFRPAPYAAAVGFVVAAYLAGLAAIFLSSGGLDPAAYDCTSLFCSPTDATLIIGIVAIPSTVAAIVFAVLGLVVAHHRGGRLHWVAEGAMAALAGIALSVAATVAVVVVAGWL